MRVAFWVVGVGVVSVCLAVVPDPAGCSGPTAHWVILEPLSEALGIKRHFRADGVFGPWIGLVGLGVVPGLAAMVWGFRANARARDTGSSRVQALLIGLSGGWLALGCLWAFWAWPGP